MIRKFLLFYFLILSIGLQGQQVSNYSLFMMNEFNWNPAYAGLDESLSITGGLREQWTGLSETATGDAIGPSTQFINAHLPAYLLRGGFGVQLENDAIGPEQNFSYGAAYNFQTYLGPGVLSIGIGGGIIQKELNGNILRTPDGNYGIGTIDHNDILLPNSTISGSAPTVRLGAYYKSDWFEIGISGIHLNEPKVELDQLAILLRRTFYVGGSFHLNLTNAIQLHPSFLIKSDANQTQTDLSAYFQINNNFLFGTGLRGFNSNNLDAAMLLAGFKLSKKISLAYAYDITLSGLQNVSSGSHELVINYNLQSIIGAGRPPKVIYNPRNL